MLQLGAWAYYFILRLLCDGRITVYIAALHAYRRKVEIRFLAKSRCKVSTSDKIAILPDSVIDEHILRGMRVGVTMI